MNMLTNLRRRVVATVAGLVVMAGASGVAAVVSAPAAHAVGKPSIVVVQSPGGCNSVPNAANGLKNPPHAGNAEVQIQGWNFHNGVNVWYGAQDLVDGKWYGGWIRTGDWYFPQILGGPRLICDVANFAVNVRMPKTACGHPMRAAATDFSDNSGHNPEATYEVKFTLQCTFTPTIMASQTPTSSWIDKGQVEVRGDGAKPDGYRSVDGNREAIWVGIQDIDTGAWYATWTHTDISGRFALNTGDNAPAIPASACGHRFTGYADDWSMTPTIRSNFLPEFRLFCGPQINFDGGNGFEGRYFTGRGLTTVRLFDLTTRIPVPDATVRASVIGTITGTLPANCDQYSVQVRDVTSGQWSQLIDSGPRCGATY